MDAIYLGWLQDWLSLLAPEHKPDHSQCQDYDDDLPAQFLDQIHGVPSCQNWTLPVILKPNRKTWQPTFSGDPLAEDDYLSQARGLLNCYNN